MNENTKLWESLYVAWLRLLVTRPNNGSAGEHQRGQEKATLRHNRGKFYLD